MERLHNMKSYLIYDTNDKNIVNKFKKLIVEDIVDGTEILKNLNKTDEDTIKNSLVDLMKTNDFISIIPSKPVKSIKRYYKYQIECAITSKKPIVVFNDSIIRGVVFELLPTLLKKNLNISVPLDKKVFNHFIFKYLEDFPLMLKNNKKIALKLDENEYVNNDLTKKWNEV